MSSVWSTMDIGKRSMMNSKAALQTVSHNVSNKGTEGYSRQRVEVKSNPPTGEGNLRIGTGARAGEVKRVNNSYIEKQLEQEGSELGYSRARSNAMSRVEQVYNEQVDKKLNKSMSEFFNGFRELAKNPESLATRSLVKENANHLTKSFRDINTQLQEIQKDIDSRISVKVKEINEITKEIAELNKKIQTVEISGATANDERDRRDLLLKKLSEKINIRYTEGKDGKLTVTAGENALLVSGHSHREISVAQTQAKDGKQEGRVEIFYKPTNTAKPVNITRQVKGGELGGLLNVRDNTINGLFQKMDKMAYTLSQETNKAHTHGYDKYNQKGEQFFEFGGNLKEASENIKVKDSIKEDAGKIVAAAAPNAPGDNRIANILASLENKKVMNEGSDTISDYYNSIVGEVGAEAKRAESSKESQKSIVDQLKNIRESISGVSIDEETTKMIEYQKAFDASARLIKTANQMMDTVLNLKRI